MPKPLALAALGVLALGAGAAVAAGRGGGRVLYRERADGVHPDLQWLLDQWESEGSHVVEIAGGPNWPHPGGLRSSELGQAATAAMGLSKAVTLQETPHGRGAALDVWPRGFRPDRSYAAADQLPGARELMATFGAFARSRGLVWGGLWSTPDDPHVELCNWRSLPFPPPDYRLVNHV